ncbi:hypothetical protein AB0L40_16280 [Patulibacter sp. NPDC049589]|uniref:hypothetical protein n=1 Tax=Patulibacter sp. NPDC049589 TaxID=3154731 RepID=UPI003435608A
MPFIGPERGDARLLDPTVPLDPAGTVSPSTQRPDTLSWARCGGSAAVLPSTSRSIFLGGYGSGLNVAPDGHVARRTATLRVRPRRASA